MLALLVSLAFAAGPDDLTLTTLSGRAVVLELSSGLEVQGTILSFDADTVVIVQPGGKVASLPRAQVEGLRLVETPAAAPAPAAAPPPAASAPPPAPAPAAPPPAPVPGPTEGPSAPAPGHAAVGLYLELLGNAGVYSINIDGRPIPELALRAGFMHVPAGQYVDAAFTLVPVQVAWLYPGADHNLEAGLGPMLGRYGQTWAIAGTGTLGYRYSPMDGGFLFRAGFTPVLGKGGFRPLVGISLGVVL